MGVGFRQASDRVHYLGADVPVPAAGMTITGWLSRIVDLGAYSCFFRIFGGATIVTLSTFENGDTPGIFTIGGTSSWATQPLVNDTWAPVAFTILGDAGTIWQPDGLGGTLQINGLVGSGAANTPTGLCLGGRSNTDATEWYHGRMAFWRIWEGVHTEAEILEEWSFASAVKPDGLWADYWLTDENDLEDHSGNGNHLTLGTTSPTGETSPDLPLLDASRWQRGDGVSLVPYMLTGTGLVEME